MKQKDILFLLISSFIVTVIWVGFNLHNSSVTSTISDTQGMQIRRIDPIFDPQTVSAIENRKAIQPIYESIIKPQQSANSAITPIPDTDEPQPLQATPQPTQSISPTPTVTTEPSGILTVPTSEPEAADESEDSL
jgi:hypothetical protein